MATKAKLESVAKRQKSFLLTSVAADRKLLLEAIAALEERILKLARKRLETDDAEKLISPKVNLKQAQALHEEIVREFEAKYGKAARQVTKGYTEVAEMIRSSWKDLDLSVEYTKVDRDLMSTLRDSYYDEFTKFGQQAQKAMTRAMYDAVAGQASFSVVEAAISAALTGKLAKNGRPMSTYAKQFANDATMNFHNAVTMKKADDAGIEQFVYYGNLMATSRPFCIERAGNTYTRKQIDSWTFSWKGKSGPAMTHRGGYNCRHHWMPVSSDWEDFKAGKTPKRRKPMTAVGRMAACASKGNG